MNRFATTGMLAAMLLPGAALAATAQTGISQAAILEDIQFSVLLDMDLGKVAVGGTAGTVELNPATNNRTCTATMVCVGTHARSVLQLTGSDANVQVLFAPTFNLTGPGQDIVAEPLFPGGSGAIISMTGGSATVYFGARLNINANQAPGLYNGTFTLNLEYN